jgi:antitoxin ParD1/3/4
VKLQRQVRSGTKNWYHRAVGKNTSFSLDEHYSAFIDDEVASGRYRSASDVVRAALRLLEDRETQLRALREALTEGERSGPSTPFDFDAFLARKRAGEPGGR